MTELQLLEKKKEIDKAKTKLSELIGEEKALLKQMKDTFVVSTLPEAKKKIINFETKVHELIEKIETETAILIQTYFKEEN